MNIQPHNLLHLGSPEVYAVTWFVKSVLVHCGNRCCFCHCHWQIFFHCRFVLLHFLPVANSKVAGTENKQQGLQGRTISKGSGLEPDYGIHLFINRCGNGPGLANRMAENLYPCSGLSFVVAAAKFVACFASSRNLLLLAASLDASAKNIPHCPQGAPQQHHYLTVDGFLFSSAWRFAAGCVFAGPFTGNADALVRAYRSPYRYDL